MKYSPPKADFTYVSTFIFQNLLMKEKKKQKLVCKLHHGTFEIYGEVKKSREFKMYNKKH